MTDENRGNHRSGAEAMVRMLELYGVECVFGLCGDTSLPFYDAMARMDHGIRHILTRDERHAAYMADGYARITGRPGVCEGPSGGGATYILPGLVEANESSIPILALTTDVATTSRGRYPLTELDQPALFRPLTKWNGSLDDGARLPAMMRAAFRAMTSGRPGAAHLALPFDTQKAPVSDTELWGDPRHQRFPAERVAPDPRSIRAAAQVLRRSRRGVIVCGGGVVVSEAWDELARVARALEIPVATSVSGQGSIAETDPLAVGVLGSNGGTPATRAVVDEADVVVFVGCRAGSVTTERWRSPKPGVPVVHIDADPMVLGANYPTHTAVCADAKLALSALADELEDGSQTPSHDGITRSARAWKQKQDAWDTLASRTHRPILPEAVVAALGAVLDDDAILVADPGTPCPYFSAYYRWRRPGRRFVTNRAHGALGYALGAAMGAHLGDPSAKTVCAMGDGSFGFCCGELETIKRYRLPITMVVFSNATYGWIKAGQKSGFGGRFYNVDFERTDHAAVARAFGVDAWTVDDPADLPHVLQRAVDSDAPTLVDVISQPLQDTAAPVSEWIA